MLYPNIRFQRLRGCVAARNAPGGDVDETATAAETITIVYAEAEPDAKGLSSRDIVTKIGSLDTAVLSANLAAFCKRISGVLTSVAGVAGGFRVDSFEVTLDITARGEIRMISSVSSEIHGGVKLIFTRQSQDG